MLKDTAARIFETIRRHTAHDVEVTISSADFSLTRFANNGIHQNVSDSGVSISIRTAFDGKTARATTNKTDDESLRRTLEAAERLTRVQESDPDMLPMASAEGEFESGPSRHFAETAVLMPEDRANTVGEIVDVAKRNKVVAAGIYSSSESFEAIFNSNGVARSHRQTLAEVSITMLSDATRSSGWQKANSPDVRALDPVRMAEIAVRKALDSADPQELPPGKYTVILEPSAVLDLVGFMFQDFGAQSVIDERSFLNDRMGQRLFSEMVTITDDAYHPLQAGQAFDGEGVPKQRVPLVEKGVIKNLVYSRSAAERVTKSDLVKRLGAARPTGHGFSLPNDLGDMPMNIVFAGPPAGQSKTVEQMIAETDRGILVTRCWYIREVEPYQKVLTGMTRDGTFLIEDGKLKHGIRNFRFNQSLVEMLQNILAMGTPVRASGEEAFDMVVPALKVKDFHFSSVTKF